jgi:hypothetical protein
MERGNVQSGQHGSYGGGPRVCWAKCGGFDFLFLVLNSVFILRPFNFMIAMVNNLQNTKKDRDRISRPAVLGFC